MKRASLVAMLTGLATLWGGSQVRAEEYYPSNLPAPLVADSCECGTPACAGVCVDDCNRGWCLYGEAEALFFRYSRADGTRVGSSLGERIDSEYQFAPRLTFGLIGDSGLGARIRWFEFDESMTPPEGGLSSLDVDTYTVDIEAFERFSLNRAWDLELSGGVRYNEFDEVMNDEDLPEVETRINSFTGWGGIVGATFSRNVGPWGGVFGRLRQAVLVDDKYIRNENGNDQAVELSNSIVGVTEIATGWEYTRPTYGRSLLTLRAGYEWQLWHNYSSSFAGPVTETLAFPASAEEVYTGPADVGFDGFTLSAAIRY